MSWPGWLSHFFILLFHLTRWKHRKQENTVILYAILITKKDWTAVFELSEIQRKSPTPNRRILSLILAIHLHTVDGNPWVQSAAWQWVMKASGRLWGVDLSQFEGEPNQ